MEKGSSALESGEPRAFYTVFIDTSLDTHLVMIVSDEDTVCDLKQKIMIEHPRCFPKVGEIIIHALKVRRKACFYHLSDSMHVKSAFDGVKRSWCLLADAASSQVGPMKNLLFLESGSGAKNKCDSGVLKKHDLVSEGNEVPETHTGYEKGKSKKRVRDMACDDTLGEALESRKIKKHKNEKKIEDAFCYPVKGLLDENESSTFVSGKELSKPEKIFPENALEDKEKSTSVTSDGLLSKLLENGHSLQCGLDSGKREKKKKKKNKNKNKLSSFCDEVDSVVLSFGKNVRQENSKEASGNNHKELGKESDAAIVNEETIWSATHANLSGLSEKEKHCAPVQEVGEGNLILCSSSGRPHVFAAKAAVVDTDSLVAMDMGESGGSKVETGTDVPGEAVASGWQKSKRLRKHRAASAKGLTLPLLEELDSLTRATTPSFYEDDGHGNEDIDIGVTDKIGKEEKSVRQSGDHKIMSSEATNSKSKLLDEDEAQINIKAGVGSSGPLDASGVTEAQDLSDKRRKKSKKTKSSNAKSRALSFSVEHPNTAGDVIPLRSEPAKAFDNGYPGDETNSKGNLLYQTGKTELSEFEDGGPANDNFGTGLTNKTEKKEITLPQNGDPKIMSSDATISKCKSLGLDEAELNVTDGDDSSNLLDVSGIIEAGDPSDKRKKKSKKSKASRAKSHVLLSSGVEQSKSVGDVIPSRSKPDKPFYSDHPGDETNRECNTLTKTEKTEISKIQDGGPDDDDFGTDLIDKTEKEEKDLRENGDPKLMPSEAINSKSKPLGQDEAEVNINDRVGSSNLLDVAGVRDVGDPSDKRRKKSKKTRASDAKSRILSSDIKHAHGAGVVIPLRSDTEKAFCSDHCGDETNKEENILAQTDKREVSKIECGGPDDDNFGTDLNDKIEKKEKVLPWNGDPKIMPSEAINSKAKSFVLHEAETNIKDKVVTAKSFDASSTVEARDTSDKRRKKSKKTKASDSKSLVPEHADSAGDIVPLISDPDKSFDSDRPGGETNREENILSQTEEMKTSKMRSLNVQLLGFDEKDGQGSGNESDSLLITQVTRVEETTYYSNDEEKSVKALASTSRPFLDPPIQIVATGLSTPPTDENKAEENAPSKKMKKSRSGKKRSINHLTDSMVEAGKQYQPSDSFEGNVQGRPLLSSIDEAKEHMEIPNSDGEMFNFIDYFLPKQDHHEIVAPAKGGLGGKEIEIRKSDEELKANKKSKKFKVHSGSTSSLNSNENQGHEKNPQVDISDKNQLQGPLTKNEKSRLAPQPNGKASIISGERVKAPTFNDHDKIDAFPTKVSRKKTVVASVTINPMRAPPVRSLSRANTNTSSRENNAVCSASTSSTESSENRVYKNKRHGELQLQSNSRRVAVGKSYSKKPGEVLNHSNNEKSLLATSNTIFKDSSTESSEDEGGVNISEASTRSPSHNSSSSDYSEGLHEANLESPGNGSNVRKRVENGGNNITSSQSAGPKYMTLDMILRSSRSYKKAKLTASQSQPEDSESQPIDFVLDSLA